MNINILKEFEIIFSKKKLINIIFNYTYINYIYKITLTITYVFLIILSFKVFLIILINFK